MDEQPLLKILLIVAQVNVAPKVVVKAKETLTIFLPVLACPCLWCFSPSGSPMKLVSIPENPSPENPSPDDAVTGRIRTPDGVELRFARWDAPVKGKGTVCVFGGRGEFIEKYFETVRELRQRGFAVAAMDWRGQGHSSRQLPNPRKGHVASFAEFEIDVDTFMRRVVVPDCPPPYFALAHSMGGAVLLRVAHSGKRWFERMVLAAPMIDLPRPRASWLLRILIRTLRLAGFPEREGLAHRFQGRALDLAAAVDHALALCEGAGDRNM